MTPQEYEAKYEAATLAKALEGDADAGREALQLCRAGLDHGNLSRPLAAYLAERLWLVVQMNSKDAAENAAIRAEAQALEPGWVLLSRIKLDQSYEPRIVSVDVR